jgi:hypothetical protein
VIDEKYPTKSKHIKNICRTDIKRIIIALNIDILRLGNLVHDRHLLNHRKIRSTGEQQHFINHLNESKFSTKFMYHDFPIKQWLTY